MPGQAGTAWTFGCAAGVDDKTSLGANTWNFTSYTGSFDVSTSHCGEPFGGCDQAVPVRSTRPIELARPGIGLRAGRGGSAELSALIRLPLPVHLAGAAVRLDRLLFESAGRGELAGPHGGRFGAAPSLTLRRRPHETFVAQAASQPGVRVLLRRIRPHGPVEVTLQISGSRLDTPSACNAVPAAVSLAQPPVELETRLMINDGGIRRVVDWTHRWRCARDATGTVDRLVPMLQRSHPVRAGLAITLYGPRRVQARRAARYVAVVYNRRTDRQRQRSSLWDVAVVNGRGHTLRIHELRRGRSRSLSFSRAVPSAAGSRFCVDVFATAPGVHAAHARICAVVRAASLPSGLG